MLRSGVLCLGFDILATMTKEFDEVHMQTALEEARAAKADGELPFGAVVVCKGEIVGRGRCREAHAKTVLAHAELEALHTACDILETTDLSDCTIYCTNEPCPMCAAAIFQAKIPHVIIGASRSDIPSLRPRTIDIQALADDSGYPITITRGIAKEKVLSLFEL